MSIIDQLAAIEAAALAALHDITTVDALSAWKSEYLGKTGQIAKLSRHTEDLEHPSEHSLAMSQS